MQGQLVTARELSGRLGMTPKSVRRLAASGAIPVVRIGKILRFDAEDVIAALKKASTKAS